MKEKSRKMEEIIDIYDETTGEKTGETISKNKAHQNGIWHSSIHILLINEDKTKILLQKRCPDKKLYPNMWDITVGGHITTGEEPLISAKRELAEELGLDSEKFEFQFLNKIKEEFLSNGVNSKEFVYVYLIKSDVDLEDIIVQVEEVSEARWFTKEELLTLIANDEIINHKEEFELIKNILN